MMLVTISRSSAITATSPATTLGTTHFQCFFHQSTFFCFSSRFSPAFTSLGSFFSSSWDTSGRQS